MRLTDRPAARHEKGRRGHLEPLSTTVLGLGGNGGALVTGQQPAQSTGQAGGHCLHRRGSSLPSDALLPPREASVSHNPSDDSKDIDYVRPCKAVHCEPRPGSGAGLRSNVWVSVWASSQTPSRPLSGSASSSAKRGRTVTRRCAAVTA